MQTGGRAVVSPSFVERIDSGLDYVPGRVKIGFADFEVNDFFALFLKRSGTIQDLEGSFGTKTRHSAG
jgi:hypothetical protein